MKRRLQSLFVFALASVVAASFVTGSVAMAYAHEIVFKGTVTKVEGSRIEVDTVDDKAQHKRVWFVVTDQTKVLRGDQVVSIAAARIEPKERIVVVVDHADEATSPTKALRVQLAPKP